MGISRGWGVLEKIPFVGMDGYFLQLHIAKKVNIVTCDVQFFDLTVPREWSCHTSGKISTAGEMPRRQYKKGQKAR